MSRQAAGARKRGVGEIEARSIALEVFRENNITLNREVQEIVDDFAARRAEGSHKEVLLAAMSLATGYQRSISGDVPRRVETSPPGEMVEEKARIARLLKGEKRGPYRLEEQVVEAKAPETELARAPERRTMDGVLAENDFNYQEYRAERAALQGQLEGNSLERKVELLGQIAELDRGALEAMEGVRDEFGGNKQFQNREAGLKRNLGLIERRISSGERTLEARKEAAEKRAEAAAARLAKGEERKAAEAARREEKEAGEIARAAGKAADAAARRIAGSARGTAGSVREAPAQAAVAQAPAIREEPKPKPAKVAKVEAPKESELAGVAAAPKEAKPKATPPAGSLLARMSGAGIKEREVVGVPKREVPRGTATVSKKMTQEEAVALGIKAIQGAGVRNWKTYESTIVEFVEHYTKLDGKEKRALANAIDATLSDMVRSGQSVRYDNTVRFLRRLNEPEFISHFSGKGIDLGANQRVE